MRDGARSPTWSSGKIPGASLTCFDLSPNMLDAARARLGGSAELVLGDAEGLPFQDCSFDAVWCNDSFHHYPGSRSAPLSRHLAGPRRRAAPLVVGDVWQPAPARAVMNAWLPHSAEGDVRIYSEREMREILGKWFDNVNWRRVGSTACLAIARKGH